MKRCLCLIACCALLLAALPLSAGAASVSEVMKVVNCKEYVSLRQSADAKSTRLEKVYLGEMVNHCSAAANDFIQCTYHGKTGYIQANYLTKTSYTNKDELLYNQMVVNCEEWVSLRRKADTRSERLAQVPLGAIVTACVKKGNFVLCEYGNQVGYIVSDYLKRANYSASSQDAQAVSASGEAQYPPLQSPMEVFNCVSWVSLREKASSSSARLAKVPLGASVSDCVQVSEQFIYCSYKGVFGYIQKDYLRSAAGTSAASPASAASSPFAQLPEKPSYTKFLEAGETVLNFHAPNGYTVVVQRYTSDSAEEMMAVCYDKTGQYVWSTSGKTNEVGELHATGAFAAGTQEDPEVVLFIAGQGFTAYDAGPWQPAQWKWKDEAARAVSGGLVSAVEKDGTIYLIGYHDAAPVCLSPAGKVRWAAVNGIQDIYWPWKIETFSDHIDVYYSTPVDGGDDTLCDVLSYNMIGTMVASNRKPRQE